MSDDLAPAVAVLQRKLDDQLKAAAETKKLINMLLKSMGRPEQFPDTGESSGIIRPDQFYGKQFATAATEYLEMRKQACQPDEILRGLAEGGFDFDVMGWKESDRLRSLAISLAKNNVKFHRLKNGSFGLRSWYDADFLKKATAKRTAASIAIASDEEENDDEDAGESDYILNVGDYVQWESLGVWQFQEPKQITEFTPDRAFAFVGGSKTGIPVGELIPQPKLNASSKDSAKPKSRAVADQPARKEVAS
jgi:DNA-directed RNA polymerase delta subunit